MCIDVSTKLNDYGNGHNSDLNISYNCEITLGFTTA